MRKFKLIKEFPLSPVKGTIATFKTMHEEIEGIYDMGAIPNLILTDCTQFPEFWEEVKEPLFVTEEGAGVNEGDVVYKVMKGTFCKTSEVYSNQTTNNFCWYFASSGAADQYIDENKPIYSKKQVKEAIEKDRYNSILGYELTSTYHLNLELNL